MFQGASWQQCLMHFDRNLLQTVPIAAGICEAVGPAGDGGDGVALGVHTAALNWRESASRGSGHADRLLL